MLIILETKETITVYKYKQIYQHIPKKLKNTIF